MGMELRLEVVLELMLAMGMELMLPWSKHQLHTHGKAKLMLA